jgi:hypothetical protein
MEVSDSTMVSFSMEYSIINRFLAMPLKPFIPPLVRMVTSEIITHIKQRLVGHPPI